MTGPCPEPDVIAAYCDRTLDAAERTRWLAHFAACARCQQVLGVLARLEDQLPHAQPAPAPAVAPPVRWSWGWMAPAAAVLGAAFLWIVVRPAVVGPPSLPSVPSPAATFADKDLGAGPQARSTEADLRQDVARERREKALLRQARATVPVNEAAAPAAAAPPPERAAGEEAAKAEAEKPKAVPAAQANVSAAAPGVAGAVAAGPESGRLVQPAAVIDRVQARPQVAAEAQPAPTQMMRTGAQAPSTLITSPDRAVMWRLGLAEFVERSTDGGKSWQRQETGAHEALAAGSAPAAVVCWLVGRQGTVVRTINGTTWEAVTPPAQVDLVRVTARDGQSATVIAADGRRFETTDGGRTWQER